MAQQELRVRLTASDDGLKASIDNAVRDINRINEATRNTAAQTQANMARSSQAIHASNQRIVGSLSTIAGLLASSNINKLTGDFVDFGQVVSALFAGRLVGQFAEFARVATNAAGAALQNRAAILANAEAATIHHRQMAAQIAATIANGNASAAYTARLRENVSASLAAMVAARAQVASISITQTAFAALGGPVGVITVAATALALWASFARSADDQTKRLTKSTGELSGAVDKLNAQILAQRIIGLQDALTKIGNANPAGVAKLKEMIADLEAILEKDAALQARIQGILQRARGEKPVKGGGGKGGDIGPPKVSDWELEDPEAYGQRMRQIAREAYPEATKTAQEYGEEQAKLAEQWLKGQESAEAYGQRMRDLAREAYPEATKSAQEYGEEQAEIARKWLEGQKTFAQEWKDLWGDATTQFASNFGHAVADAVVDQKKFADVMRVSVRSMAREVIAALVTIAAQRAALWIAERIELASTATTAAPAAAAVTLASFGSNVPVAIAGMAATFAAAKNLAGQAHDGLDNVPRTGTYLLEQGERVVKKEDSKRLERFLNNQAGSNVINVNFTVTGKDAPQAAEIVRSQKGTIVSLIQEMYDRRGTIGGPIR